MYTIECKKVCPDCPLNSGYEPQPNVIVELGWEVTGTIGPNARSVTFELRNGVPVGERLSRVALGKVQGSVIRRASSDFRVKGSSLDDGTLVAGFESCSGSYVERRGFFGIGRRLGCGALKAA